MIQSILRIGRVLRITFRHVILVGFFTTIVVTDSFSQSLDALRIDSLRREAAVAFRIIDSLNVMRAPDEGSLSRAEQLQRALETANPDPENVLFPDLAVQIAVLRARAQKYQGRQQDASETLLSETVRPYFSRASVPRANIYIELAEPGFLLDDSLSLYYADLALQVSNELVYPQGAIQALTHLGNILLKLGEFDESFQAHNRSFDLSVEIMASGQLVSQLQRYTDDDINFFLEKKLVVEVVQAKDTIIVVSKDLSSTAIADQLLSEGKVEEAISFYEQSIVASDTTGNISEQLYVSSKLSESYEKLGQYDRSLSYYKSYATMRDSLLSAISSKRLEDQRAEEERARQQLLQRAGMTTGATVFIVIIIFAINLSRQNKRIKAASAENERLLLNILPSAIASRLKQGEDTIADKHQNVTVLFSDMVGFTKLSASLEASELVVLLNKLVSEIDALAQAFQIEKIKTIGDAYMAVAGLRPGDDDHAERMVRFAVAMNEAVEKINPTLDRPIQLRIGVHSGPVVAGVIGSHKFAFDLWGDTVNTASRMESHGIPGKVQLSETTAQLLSADISIAERGTISVKGKGEMRTFLVENTVPVVA